MRIDRYLPDLLRAELVGGSRSVAAPDVRTVEGSFVLADITGFTGLAERLAEAGPDGAERLSAVLNLFFGELVSIVRTHGGDILKFAGDAMLACWVEPSDGSLPGSDDGHRRGAQALAATACAVEFQRVLHGRTVSPGIELRLRAQVASGAASWTTVAGAGERRDLVLWGPALTQLGAAGARALPGEVVLTAESRRRVGDAVACEALGDSAFRVLGAPAALALVPNGLKPSTVSEHGAEAARAFVPWTILGRFADSERRWLGELRVVTAMFVKAPNLGGPDRAVAEGLQRFYAAVAEAVHRYGGSLNKASVDEKGLMLLAVWGMAPHGFEDDAARALRAAHDLAKALASARQPVAVGVAAGRLYCGILGSEERAEYTCIGDAVNLAARLCDRGEVGVICDESCARRAGRELELEPAGTHTIKGKAQGVALFRLSSVTAGATGRARAVADPIRSAGLIGRVAEREMIRVLIDDLRAGLGGRVAVVEGPAGFGKSRLVAEAVTRAGDLPCAFVQGVSVEATTPYFGWRALFAEVFGLAPDLEPPQVRAAVERWAEWVPELQPFLALLSVVVPAAFPESNRTEVLSGEIRAEACRATLAAAIRHHTNGRPMLLVVEDAHWLDERSKALLERVVADVPGVSVLVTTRPATDGLDAQFEAAAGTQRVVLGPLGQAEVAQLVADTLEVSEAPAALVALVLSRAGGNPFFTEELTRAVRDAGVVTLDRGRCVLLVDGEALVSVPLPSSVRALVTSRVDRLDPEQQLSLKVASVVGPTFSIPIVAGVHPVQASVERHQGWLDPLVENHLLRLLTPQPDKAYTFQHALTQEAVYDQMLFGQRRELHSSAARWIERRFAADLAPHHALLAHHWTRAEVWEAALRYNELAGRQALDRFANHAAVGFLTRARDIAHREGIVVEAERRSAWARDLAHAFYGAGQLDRCEVEAEVALAGMGWPMPKGRLQRAIGLVAAIVRRVVAGITPRRAPVEGAQADRRLQAVRLQTRLSEAALFRQDIVGLLLSGIREIDLGEPAGPTGELGRAYGTMAAILGTVPLRGLAERCVTLAETSAGLSAPADRAFILTRCAVYGVYGAQWTRCRRWLDEALSLSAGIGDDKTHQDSWTIRLLVDHFEGRLRTSLDGAVELGAFASRRGLEQGQAWSRLIAGTNLLPLGRLEEAEAALDEGARWCLRLGSAPERIWADGLRALCACRRGDRDRAAELAGSTLTLIEAGPPTAYWIFPGLLGVIESFHLLAGADGPERPRYVADRDRAVRALRRFTRPFPLGLAAFWLWRGIVARSRGRRAEALRAFQRAEQEAATRGQRQEEAHALFGIGVLGEGAHASVAANRARELLTEIGLPLVPPCFADGRSGGEA